ncbi:MAG: hypothetical protein QGG60_03020 [Anaerolineales bacterium]|mgnify:CR=1 FL=1|nr:hypothetical protein [Pseudomonadales bacterium]MDP7643652.1 hypothetical protein [Anaerolineales bacterium]
MDEQPIYRPYYDMPSDEAIEALYSGMRRFWHSVLPSEESRGGEPKSVELLQEKILLVRLI